MLTVKERLAEIGKEIESRGNDTVNYIFSADFHIDEYLRKDSNGELTVYESEENVKKRTENLIRHFEEIVDFANSQNNIDFIALGGDYINSYSIKGKESVLNLINTFSAPLKRSKKPVIMAFGNHDDNGFQTLNPNVPEIRREWLISDKDWSERVMDNYPFAEKRVGDEKYKYSKYFYFDIEKKSTRVVVLDTMDMRRPFDSNGNVTGDGTLPRFWYTNEQLDWLVNTALTAGDGWNYIFISHMGIDYETSDNCKNGEILRGIITAFNKKEEFTFSYNGSDGIEKCVKADFKNPKNGKIVIFNFGHQHAELCHYSEDMDLWQVATGCENAFGGWGCAAGNKELPWVFMEDRTENTENETCFDTFSVNSEVCRKYNVGPGKDREMR